MKHVDTCESCRIALDDFIAIADASKDFITAPAGLHDSIMQAVKKEKRRNTLRRIYIPAISFAAALTIFLVVRDRLPQTAVSTDNDAETFLEDGLPESAPSLAQMQDQAKGSGLLDERLVSPEAEVEDSSLIAAPSAVERYTPNILEIQDKLPDPATYFEAMFFTLPVHEELKNFVTDAEQSGTMKVRVSKETFDFYKSELGSILLVGTNTSAEELWLYYIP